MLEEEHILKSAWPYRKIVLPIIDLLRQGITPEKVALSIALGVTLGIFPVLGSTTILCAAAAVVLRLNLPAIQAVNYLIYPIGDTLIIWMTGLGITTPNGDPNGKPLATGHVPPLDGSVLYETPTLPTVTIGGVTAKVLYSVLAPGYPGDYQVAVEVPTGVTNGDDVPVVVTMFGNSDTATLSIQPRP
jgi:uncharacterized protein (TIGR03437 family)